MSDRQGNALVRVVAVIAMVPLIAFSSILFLIHSPKAGAVSGLVLVPLGVQATWLVTGRFTIDLVPLLRRLKGWRLSLAVGVPLLLFLYICFCLVWLLSGVR
jgi:hypothetical protein